MKVTLIGSGNLATNLGHALRDAQVEILQIYSRTPEHAERLATSLGVNSTCSEIDEINTTSDVYIVSVKDTVMTALVADLRRRLPNAIIAHTAGSMTVPGADVFYPLQTFSRERIVSFSHIPIFLEASCTEHMQTLHALATKLTDSVYELSADNRRWLHVAAVFCCNFSNHMSTIAAHILETHGIPFNVMIPLIDETTHKLHHLTPHDAQTGPAARHDQNVIDRHLAMLSEEPQLADIYKLLTESILHYD